MAKRAAVCVGVNRAGSLTPLQAAVKGARDFAEWAKAQGCDTELLIDSEARKVAASEIFDVVQQFVDAATYSQLIVYFSGHGILSAPGTEYWLLSRAPQNPNEAVNLSRSVVDARNSGIPHVVFISDACRSSVTGPPLSGVSGSVIFPSRPIAPKQGEVDVYYATRPGDPAYEVPEVEATQKYRGIFTDALLKVVKAPPAAMVENVASGARSTNVITSRRMKDYLEAVVPVDAEDIDIKLRQAPQVIVETALPKYFAEVGATTIVVPAPPAPQPPAQPGAPGSSTTADDVLAQVAESHRAASVHVTRTGFVSRSALQINEILSARGRGHFETRTGFTVFGVSKVNAEAQRWNADPAFPADSGPRSWHVRLNPNPGEDQRKPSTVVFNFEDMGAALAILPGFIGTVMVTDGRVTSVSYVPSDQTGRYKEYQKREEEVARMKALAAVASRNGQFVVDFEKAKQFADRIRQDKGIDPTMGLYAAYAYAQAGAYDDVFSVYIYMRNDEVYLPIPFDVGMLATRFRPQLLQEPGARFAPFFPMLAQGWALLGEGDPMFDPIHKELRPHLVPALWTTLSLDGVRIASEAIRFGRVK